MAMDLLKLTPRLLGFVLLLLVLDINSAFAIRSISLSQAEQAALLQSPELVSFHAKARSLEQKAVAAGQYPDPQLFLGTQNIPVDTFSFTQEDMTQIQVGLQQSFPKGHSLRYQSLKKEDLSRAELEKAHVMNIQILQQVRLDWLTLYYWKHAKKIVQKQRNIFHHLIKVTASLLANNKTQQKDVIRAQFEFNTMNDRLIHIDKQIRITEAELGRWIGPRLAKLANPKILPIWKKPPSFSQLGNMIQYHPELQTDQAFIAASHAEMKLAEEQFKPGFTVGVAYGFRQGVRTVNNTRRSNFLTAQVSMDLPIFPHNRQSRELAASEEDLLSTEENKISHFRQLREYLKSQYDSWKQFAKSSWLYRSQLVPQAKHYASATLVAYQNAQTDFPTLARAYLLELEAELSGLKVTVDRDKARVNLLYLEGK